MSSIKAMFSVFVVCSVFLLCSSPAYAYLDPGSGSYIFQILLAALLGASFAIKTFWRNIALFVSNLFSRGQERDNKSEHDSQ